MKNEIKISRLMDAYTDNEFFIQGESEVNMETVKNNVIEKATGAKKRMKPVAKILIGVAAAAVLAVGATATTVAIMKGSVTNASGATYDYEIREDHGYTIQLSPADYGSILTLEDGRLYFNINDDRTDVTDLMDNQTPYIYAYTNTDTGLKNYVVLGGTPEEYYIVDLTYLEGIGWQGDGALNGIAGNMVQFRLENFEAEAPGEEDTVYMSLTFGKNFVKENGEVHPVEGGWPYHYHHVTWSGGTASYNEIPENWETDCMDAWLLKALIQLEIIPNFE